MAKTTIELITETAGEIQRLAGQHESCILSYSGGKDSRCLAELCCKAFQRVVFMFMYFVPGLRCCETDLDFARQRWKAEIVQYPHWANFRDLREGVHCPNYFTQRNLPDVKVNDIYAMARQDLGIKLVVRGGKRADSLWRRRMLAAKNNNPNIVDPLRDWHKYETLAFLSSCGIPLPDGEGNESGTMSGVGLTVGSICWMHDKFRDDYDKVVEVFPYVPSIICRRCWYGVGKYYDKDLEKQEAEERLQRKAS